MLLSALFVALQFLTVKPIVANPTVFVIAYDDSTSQHSAQFGLLPDFARDCVLPMMRPGDTIVLLRMAHAPNRPGPEPEVTRLDKRTRVFSHQVLQFNARIRHVPQFPGDNQTDVGLMLDYVRHAAELDRQVNIRTNYVVVGLTDGQPDGPQSGAKKPARERPAVASIRIAFLGVNRGTEAGLMRLVNDEGIAEAPEVLIVPHTLMAQQVDGVQRFVGLGRLANADLVGALREPDPATSIRKGR